MDIKKIVLTGGPCAGKSTALSKIGEFCLQWGYTPVFVPESATELICGGITPSSCGTNLDFQYAILQWQLEKERIFEQAAATMPVDNVLIVCDRGALDNKAYMGEEEYRELLRRLNTNEVDLRDNYDAVFHLVSAAKGAAEFYTTANNAARRETVEEAIALDDKIIAAWTGHPHMRAIDNSSDFDEKIRRLLTEIAAFLGKPAPLETERKFLIEYPDLSLLDSLPHCHRVEIIQTYLKTENGDEMRVRQRGEDGHYVYFCTEKRRINGLKRVETERRLTKDEYLRLLMDADTDRRQIRKNRYCLLYKNQYFEIDVYPFWDDRAIVELELSDENAPVEFPEWLRIIREVTDDDTYKNANLARKNP